MLKNRKSDKLRVISDKKINIVLHKDNCRILNRFSVHKLQI